METTVVRTEAEALLLENNLIKTLNPKFNILFRDDKSYPYLKLVSLHAFPRAHGLLPRRGRPQAPLLRALSQRLGGEGDHPVAAEGLPAAHLRGHGVPEPVTALPAVPDPALLGALRRPSSRPPTTHATCAHAERFLLGEQQQVIGDLQSHMMSLSDALEFEKAAEVRDRIGALSRVLHQQSMDESSLSAAPPNATSTSWP
jgi:excinuclease ABC subunit C